MLLTLKYYDMKCTMWGTIGTENRHRREMCTHIKIGFSNTNSATWGRKPTSNCGEPSRLQRVGWMSWTQMISKCLWRQLQLQVRTRFEQSLFLPLPCIGPQCLKKTSSSSHPPCSFLDGEFNKLFLDRKRSLHSFEQNENSFILWRY